MVRHRLINVLLPVLAAVVGVVAWPVVSVAAPSGVTVQRIFGADRYATSAAIARDTFGASATPIVKAVIANGNDFPDAVMGANFLSGYFGPGPVLLTRPHDLPQPIVDVIRQLRIPQPEIFGGTAVVDLAVQRRLQTLVDVYGTMGAVGRYSGSDRYATGAAVVRSAFDHESNQLAKLDSKNTAFLVSGVSATDALAAAPLTYAVREGSRTPLTASGKFPLLLTRPDVLSVATRNALLSTSSGDGRSIEQVIVIGGPGAVSQAVLTQINALGISTRRIEGIDRQATAVAVAEFAIQTLGWNPAHINLARGDNLADAMSAAPHAGEELAPLLFTLSPDQLGTATADFLRAHAGITQSIDVLGGPGAVSDAVVAQARAAAGG
jgi:putative cell wall-binding protein